MKLSVSAYRAHASAHKKILSSSYQLNYGSTANAPSGSNSGGGGGAGLTQICLTGDTPQLTVDSGDNTMLDNSGGPGPPSCRYDGSGVVRNSAGGDLLEQEEGVGTFSPSDAAGTGGTTSLVTSRDEDDDSSNPASSECKSPGQMAFRALSVPMNSFASSSDNYNNLIEDKSPDIDLDLDLDMDMDMNNVQGNPSLQTDGSKTSNVSAIQSWRNVRAVMTYYNSLRKIKRTKSNQRWMKLRTTVQLSSAISTIQKKPPLKREDSFLKRFSTRQIPETQETVEDTGSEGNTGDQPPTSRRRRRVTKHPRTVVNPDENFYFYWLMLLTGFVLYNMWTLIVRQSFPELQILGSKFWFICDCLSDLVFILDLVVQLRTGYLEQGLMVYDSKKLAGHYIHSRPFLLDLGALCPLDLLQLSFGTQPMLRFPRFLKVYRAINYYYMVESRTVWPNLWRVVNLIHILLILAHWFGCFYFLLSEAEGFQGDWVYPYRPGDYATLTRKYLGSLYWSTLTLTTIGDLPTPETNAEPSLSVDGPRSLPKRGLKSRLLQFRSNGGYIFTIVSYLIGVFIFATIVGQVGNVITNRNANRLEFERLLDGAKTYMRHHKVPGGMKRRVLRWYDYSWSRGRIQGGGDINTALGLLPDKLKTELALHVNLSVLKKVTIFQECQPEFLHDLVLKMKAYIFTPGDSICRKGEVAREMFIIADGILEVISETGRVLTTMKAGDFFGEIGILNLDGLNKRTADVRSVGYSELFSLSREDVLAAMKDYPEAQEILQSLGRKRLMEVRNVAKRYGKGAKASGNDTNNQAGGQGDSSDNSASKRIVDKLKSDVKGLRNVLRKSRTGRRSNESMELQPLHAGNSASHGYSKGMLRRMPRVKSDEFATEAEDAVPEPEEKVCSPLGAGLPLLSRLRLLKEKQDREERAAKATTPLLISPPQQRPHCSGMTLSPQESIQEEPCEVIGAGLPLLQRLLLLKAKEDKQQKERELLQQKQQPKQTQLLINTAASSLQASNIGQSLSPTSPLPKALSPTIKALSPSSKHFPSDNPSPSLLSASTATAGAAAGAGKIKVSFKDRIKNLQSGTHSEPASKSDLQTEKKSPNKNISMFKDKLKLLSSSNKEEVPKLAKQECEDHKPWLKLKKATVLTDSASNIDLSAKQDSLPRDLVPNPSTKSKSSSSSSDLNMNLKNKNSYVKPSDNKDSDRVPNITNSDKPSVDDNKNTNNQLNKRKLTLSKLCKDTKKNYLSVDDLSPEYCGLPFVKKLKILNERQKLAELESVIKTRSSSLDCTSETSSENSLFLSDTLTRSHSEASAMGLNKVKGNIEAPIVAMIPKLGNKSSRIIKDQNECCSRINSAEFVVPEKQQIQVPSFTFPPPQSPESNETIERRNLKSILKKLSEDIPLSEIQDSTEFKQLLRAPTIEGFAARHSKLTKSVTFNRNTLTSPPNSANICEIENKSLFPILSTISHQNANANQNEDHNLNVESIRTISERNNIIMDEISRRKLNNEISSDNCSDNRLLLTNNNGVELSSSPTDISAVNTGEIDITTPLPPPPKSKFTFISAVTNQRKLIRGSLEDQEYFGEVLVGIKQVIQGHLQDVQGKFHEQFKTLELEVRKRDDIINQLQNRIQELETQTPAPVPPPRTPEDQTVQQNYPNCDLEDLSGSESSSIDQPFMRGDSLDTIFTRSPPSDHNFSSTNKPRQRYHHHQQQHRKSSLQARNRQSWEDTSDQEVMEIQDLPKSISPKHYLEAAEREYILTSSDITGNLAKVYENTPTPKPDTVVLEMDSSESDSDFEEDSRNYDYYNRASERKHSDDWEVRMLAKEMDKRESSRTKQLKEDSSSEKEDLSSEQNSDSESNILLNPELRKQSHSTDTESETSGICRRPSISKASSFEQSRGAPPRVPPRFPNRTRSDDGTNKTKRL